MDKIKIRKILIKFFTQHPSPNDKSIHKLAEKMDIDPHLFEAHIYSIISDFLYGGRSKDFKGNYDQKELKMGTKVELEHTKCPLIAEKIAKDHLAELPDYYTRLKKMEEEGGVE